MRLLLRAVLRRIAVPARAGKSSGLLLNTASAGPILHPSALDVARKIVSVVQAHFAGRTPVYECETRLRTKSGEYRYNLDRGKVVEWDAAGNPVRMVGADSDITERTQAEFAQARLAAIVGSTADAIIGKDLDGIITDWNAGAEHQFGYTADEAIGQLVAILFPTERQDHVVQILARIRAGGRIEGYDTIRETKDGRLVDVSLTISPLRNAKGEVVGAATIARDISERTRMEAALRESKEAFQNYFNLSGAGIGVTSPEMTWLEVNDFHCKMLGSSTFLENSLMF
ncbi:MAG: PAS domain S-box protein [Anaerolineales bacterium]|nr:PAS domain S-box protein [Anaerolineales bacterium]